MADQKPDNERGVRSISEKDRGGREILEDERLMNQRDVSEQEIVQAAQDAFDEDQRDPDHPTRIKRELSDVEDPSHSQGI
jgi:hypothetical protein